MFFVTKEWRYRKYSLFFLACKHSVWPFSCLFLALFGFLLKFSSGNHARRTTTHQFIWQQQQKWAVWADHIWNVEWLGSTTRLRTFNPDTGTHPPGLALPRTAWVRHNRLRTGVGRSRSYLHKWSMAPSAACERGTEEQTVHHVVLSVQFIDLHMDYTAWGSGWWVDKWLLKACPEI